MNGTKTHNASFESSSHGHLDSWRTVAWHYQEKNSKLETNLSHKPLTFFVNFDILVPLSVRIEILELFFVGPKVLKPKKIMKVTIQVSLIGSQFLLAVLEDRCQNLNCELLQRLKKVLRFCVIFTFHDKSLDQKPLDLYLFHQNWIMKWLTLLYTTRYLYYNESGRYMNVFH